MARAIVKEVIVDEGLSRHYWVKDILKRLPNTPVYMATAAENKLENRADMGKSTLHLQRHMGEFLKPCPGTKAYICCGYQILNVGTNCPLDCSYCVLQSYFNQPNLRVFVNLYEQLEHVMGVIDNHPNKIFRVGTGEFTDSLAIDPITCWAESLIPAFSVRKNSILELKTKTNRIEGLLHTKYRERIIVSWSLNSPHITQYEEHKASILTARLEAARLCQKEGFIVGFHFDPLVYHQHWKEEYMRTIDLMDNYIDPHRIIWMSLGSFRFMPELKSIIRKRHPQTCVLDGEFVLGLDGKMRYFKPLRIDLYSFMINNLTDWYPDLGLYLCMESDEVWHKSLGWSPENSTGLCQYLDNRVIKFFG